MEISKGFLTNSDVIKVEEFSYNGKGIYCLRINGVKHWIATQVQNIDRNVFFSPYEFMKSSKLLVNKEFFEFSGSDLAKIKKVLADADLLDKIFANTAKTIIYTDEGLKKYITHVFEFRKGKWQFFHWAKTHLLNEYPKSDDRKAETKEEKQAAPNYFDDFEIYTANVCRTRTQQDRPMVRLSIIGGKQPVIRFNPKLVEAFLNNEYFKIGIRQSGDIAIIPATANDGVSITDYKHKGKRGEILSGEIRFSTKWINDKTISAFAKHVQCEYIPCEIVDEPIRHIIIKSSK